MLVSVKKFKDGVEALPSASEIMDAIKNNDVDCITYNIWCDIPEWGEHQYQHTIVSIIQRDEWGEGDDKKIYLTPDYKCPIKKEILNKVPFISYMRTREDERFKRDIRPYLKTEYKITCREPERAPTTKSVPEILCVKPS